MAYSFLIAIILHKSTEPQLYLNLKFYFSCISVDVKVVISIVGRKDEIAALTIRADGDSSRYLTLRAGEDAEVLSCGSVEHLHSPVTTVSHVDRAARVFGVVGLHGNTKGNLELSRSRSIASAEHAYVLSR